MLHSPSKLRSLVQDDGIELTHPSVLAGGTNALREGV